MTPNEAICYVVEARQRAHKAWFKARNARGLAERIRALNEFDMAHAELEDVTDWLDKVIAEDPDAALRAFRELC